MPEHGRAKLSETQYNHTLDLQLTEKASKNGTVAVIIELNIPFKEEGKINDIKLIHDQRNSINRTQDLVIQSLSGHKFLGVKKFQYIPFMAMKVDQESLKHLLTLKQISGIYEDRLEYAFDTNTIPLTGTNNAWSSGYTGMDQTIAILDTGVDVTHPFLTDKVVSEACYSSSINVGDTSICPNGQTTQTGIGSAVPCSISGCFHGTFVAGIAAGNDPTYLPGFAKNANIIAVQVFHENGNTISAYDSDILNGLQYIYNLRSTYNIVAVNLSLGSGGYTSTCDVQFPDYKSMFDNLRSAGIVPVVASGNNGYYNALSSPACVSSAVSVGSTNISDQISSFTNDDQFLSLLAPGEGVISSTLGGGTATGSGTSFAAPAVSGAFAILKQKNSLMSVAMSLSVLKSTGVSVTDSYSGLSFSRIHVDSALQSTPTTCIPFASGNWTVTSSCTLNSTSTAPANVIVQSGAVLTIPNGLRLNIDFTHYHLLVKSGGGVLIKSGGAIN